MKKACYLLFLIAIVFLGCQQNSLMQQLVEIDSIAFQKGDEQALEMLEKIEPEAINDEECLAYYWLLRFRTEIRLLKEIKSIEALEIPINYYKKHNNKGKLARVYGYKGYILNNQNKLREAIISLKEAEALIKENDAEMPLENNVYYTLSKLNYKAKEKECKKRSTIN